MRKKVLSGVFAIALLATTGWGVNKSMINDAGLSDLALINVEALANEESSSFCYAGGVGSTQCSIDAGIEILGVGVAGGCSVSCSGGYYACCSLRCTCKVG